MRATIGRIALVALLSAALCGCRGGSNMFAWGRKKPSDNLDDAPKYAAGNPPLPSDGQSPGTPPTNVAGTVAAGMPAYGSVNNTAVPGYGAQPAAYQQSIYPSTPYQPAPIGPGGNPSAATAPPTTASATSPWNSGANHSAASAGYGATNPTSTPYGNQAPAATQPQQGQYNLAYNGGDAAASAPSSYAGAPTNSGYPGAGSSATNVPPAAATSPMTPPQDYRTADARSAVSPGIPNSAASAPPVENNPAVGDRYGNASNSGVVGDRYSTPAENAAAASPNPSAAGISGGNGDDRYNLPPNNYQPADASAGSPDAMPTNPAANSGYGVPNEISTPPGANGNGGSAAPARPDPGYRPGGTGSFSPQANLLRSSPPDGSPESRPQGGVVPASYETTTTAGTTPASPQGAPVAVDPAATESYGAYQGGGATAQPSGGNSKAASAQPGLFHGHSW